MYTCPEIANGRQHGGIHVYHVYHAYVFVRACVHVHVYMHGTPPTYPYPPTPHPLTYHPSQGGDPRNQ